MMSRILQRLFLRFGRHSAYPGQPSGFTLIEVVLSLTIIVALVGLSMPIYMSFQTRNDLDVTAQGVVAMLRRSQTYARSMNRDSTWSVEIQSTTATLFAGTSFGSRNTLYDETLDIPASVTVTGLGEVQFAKITGISNTSGTITLTSSANDSRIITVNAKGVIDY